MKMLLILITAICICGCISTATRQNCASEEEKICQTVLLDNLSRRDTNRLAFIAFRDQSGNYIDPSDAVVARIQAGGVPVRRVSEAGKDNQGSVTDKKTDQAGMIYYVGILRWLGNSKVEVIEGSYCGGLCGGFTESTMKEKDGEWVRVKIRRMGAS